MRKTKILVTLGPAVDTEEKLISLCKAGMNVVRCNFSHGDHVEHAERIAMVRKVCSENDFNIAILVDTKGPEIRAGEVENNRLELKYNEKIILTTEECLGNSEKLYISYKKLPSLVKPGGNILLDDGLITMKVEKILNDREILCIIQNNGVIKSKRGVNIPNFAIDLPNPTEKDKKDIEFAVKHDVDFIAVSFVQCADTILEFKRTLRKLGGEKIKVIAKIENHAGLENFDKIVKVADGVMVARGDLGVELPLEDVPIVQKELIKKCFMEGKPVITATQLLHSMIENPRPTRAEVSDIANAIYDLTSAVMLSGETSIGEYPITCVEVMDKVANRTESAINYRDVYLQGLAHIDKGGDMTRAVTNAALTTAYEIGAKAIVTCTETGYTAQMLSKMRPEMPIIAVTTSEKVRRQLAINWGVFPVVGREYKTLDEIQEDAIDLSLKTGLVENGDIIVIVAGVPVGIAGATNLIKVEIVGDVLVKGKCVHPGKVTGRICLGETPEELKLNFNKGDIVVVKFLHESLLPFLKQASAIIMEDDDVEERAQIIGKTLDIPIVKSAKAAYDILKEGIMVKVDSVEGTVSKI